MSTASCQTETRFTPAEAAPSAQALWQRYHHHTDVSAENDLVQQYLPLVMSVLGRLAMTLPDHVSHDDLRSAGLVGLLQALRNYDPASGSSFEAYARVRIRGAMLDELRRMDWVPRTVHEKARKLQQTISDLEQKLGRTPTDAQVAKEMKLSLEHYQELLDQIRPATFVCLDSAPDTDGADGGSLYEVIAAAEEEGPVEQVSQRELKAVVFERLKALPEVQQKVLALYYAEDMTLREIAEAFGLTESRICQIHSQAILSIRAYVQRFESGLVSRAADSSKA